MAATWKILAALALFLILPAGAYLTGAMVGPPTAPQDQRAQLVDHGGHAPVPAREPKDRPSKGQADLVPATPDGPAEVAPHQASSAQPERQEVEKKRRAEPKPAARPAAAAGEPSEEPSPTESPDPSQAPATEEPEPTESPAPTESPEPEPEPAESDEPSPTVAPSDDPEGAVGS